MHEVELSLLTFHGVVSILIKLMAKECFCSASDPISMNGQEVGCSDCPHVRHCPDGAALKDDADQ